MWNLKRNDMDELTNKTERDSQSQRTKVWLPAHTAVFKMNNNKDLLYGHETLLSVMGQPGWEGSLGENVYMYVLG